MKNILESILSFTICLMVGIMTQLLDPAIARDVIRGYVAFRSGRHCYPVPVRCRARRWMRRGEMRIDIKNLLPKEGEEPIEFYMRNP